MLRYLSTILVCTALLTASPALAQQTFKSGSLIIPMDTTYQDSGMLRAFGLVYQLLKADVPVHWVIKAKKALGDADLTTVSKDFKSGASLASHGYRGGPFVIEDKEVSKASPLVAAWQTANPTVAVHIAQQDFQARSGRLLSAAPTIAVIDDGSAAIAYTYLNAAGIPDRSGQVWSKSSPGVLSVAAVAGPTTSKHNDGALFRPSGLPAFCQIMTMHWGVNNVVDEVVAEYRAFLQFPVHMMAECQAVNAIENNSPYGHFLTPKQTTPPCSPTGSLCPGFLIDNNVKDTGPFTFHNLDMPFVQMDGPFSLVGGSERAYSIPAGAQFFDKNAVMIKDATTPLGQRSVWMTGYIDGKCFLSEDGGQICLAGVGKISYLGGHQYSVSLPISKNPTTQGTRLFLNSLFEAGCATDEGQPIIALTKSGPSWTTSGEATYTLSYSNQGPGPALDLELTDTLATGVNHVSSTGGGLPNGSKVSWKLGDLAAGGSGTVQLTVSFSGHGTFQNSFAATFQVGLVTKTALSNTVTTVYQASPPPDAGQPPDQGESQDGASAVKELSVPGDSGSDLGTLDTKGTGADSGGAVDTSSPAVKDAAGSAEVKPGDGLSADQAPSDQGTDGSGHQQPDRSPPAAGGSPDGCGCELALPRAAGLPAPSLLLLLGALLLVRRRPS